MAGYGDDTAFATWRTDNGYGAIAGALSATVLRQRGSAYVDGVYGLRFPGSPTGGYAQERAWPRTGATAYGADIPSTAVPAAVVEASYLAALQEDASPGSLSVVVTAAAQVKREKVGPIETEYQATSGDAVISSTPLLSAIEGLLAPLLYQLAPYIVTT